MKIVLLCLLIFTALLNFSCGQKVETSPIKENEKIGETVQTSPTPEKYKIIDLSEQVSKWKDENSEPTSLNFKGYQIKPIIVKKSEPESPVADIYDAVLSKKGKTIARFEGIYYPLGNFMSFGTFSFLGDSEKQLVVIEESYKYERDWIVSLTPKYKVLFDSNDYDLGWGRLGVVDIDNDEVYELTLNQSSCLGLGWIDRDCPWAEVVFKYDAKTRRYLPANHIYTDYILENIEAQVKDYEDRKANGRTDLLKIMMKYFYVGKEDEAWKFWDDNFSSHDSSSFSGKNKEQTRETIQNALDKDPIYKFIKADLKKNN